MANQATVRPASMASCPSASQKWLLPVPEGPQTHRFSRRSTHSSERSAAWVAGGIEQRASSQASKVLPAGKPARRRRSRTVASSRPATSSASSTRSTSAGSQRCARAVGTTSAAALRR